MKTWYARHREQFPYTDATGRVVLCLRDGCDSPRMDDGGPHAHLCRECSMRDRRRAIEQMAEIEQEMDRYEGFGQSRCTDCGGPVCKAPDSTLPGICSRCEDRAFSETFGDDDEREPDLSKCPGCGGPADNGHDRCLPPSPYLCRQCQNDLHAYDVTGEAD